MLDAHSRRAGGNKFDELFEFVQSKGFDVCAIRDTPYDVCDAKYSRHFTQLFLCTQGPSKPWKVLNMEALLPPLPEPTAREPTDDEVAAIIEAMFRNCLLTPGNDMIRVDPLFNRVLTRSVIHQSWHGS